MVIKVVRAASPRLPIELDFSTSLHHHNDALHVDHFNGAKFPIGTLFHAIVDVGVGSAFYGTHRAFSYAGVQ